MAPRRYEHLDDDPEAREEPLSQKAGALGEISVEIRYIRDDIKRINQKLDSSYVTHDQFIPVKEFVARAVTQAEFEPVKKIVYTVAGLVGTAVVMALLALIIRGGV